MSITHGYCTREQLEDHLGDARGVSGDLMDRAIESVSRVIDAYTGRRFWLADTPTARLIRGGVQERLDLPDFTELSSIAPQTTFNVFGDAYDSTQYRIGPYEAPVFAEPYHWVEGACSWWWCGTLQVTATWGWPSVPVAVTQACLLKAARVFKRKESPTGVLTLPSDFGAIRIGRDDADVIDILSPYTRLAAA